jgi:hypothetical protein
MLIMPKAAYITLCVCIAIIADLESHKKVAAPNPSISAIWESCECVWAGFQRQNPDECRTWGMNRRNEQLSGCLPLTIAWQTGRAGKGLPAGEVSALYRAMLWSDWHALGDCTIRAELLLAARVSH